MGYQRRVHGELWSAKRGGNTMKGIIFISLFFSCSADFTGVARGGGRSQLARSGRQEEAIPGGIDFSGCVDDPETGLCCIDKEEVCEENFEKSCSITFKQQAYNETVNKCYTPIEKVCNGQGEEVCQTVYESSCTTKYVEKQPDKFVGDTGCEKLPVEICGAGCT